MTEPNNGPDVGFRPEAFLINPDDQGKGVVEEDEPWEKYGLAEWKVMLGGQPDEYKEKYRYLMQEEFRPYFFEDERI